MVLSEKSHTGRSLIIRKYVQSRVGSFYPVKWPHLFDLPRTLNGKEKYCTLSIFMLIFVLFE